MASPITCNNMGETEPSEKFLPAPRRLWTILPEFFLLLPPDEFLRVAVTEHRRVANAPLVLTHTAGRDPILSAPFFQ